MNDSTSVLERTSALESGYLDSIISKLSESGHITSFLFILAL